MSEYNQLTPEEQRIIEHSALKCLLLGSITIISSLVYMLASAATLIFTSLKASLRPTVGGPVLMMKLRVRLGVR